jgi:hypothetical protein
MFFNSIPPAAEAEKELSARAFEFDFFHSHPVSTGWPAKRLEFS